jgi:hypothetical protein
VRCRPLRVLDGVPRRQRRFALAAASVAPVLGTTPQDEPRKRARRQLQTRRFRRRDASCRSFGGSVAATRGRQRATSPARTSAPPRRPPGTLERRRTFDSPMYARASRSASRSGVSGRPIGMSTAIAATSGQRSPSPDASFAAAAPTKPFSSRTTASHLPRQASIPRTCIFENRMASADDGRRWNSRSRAASAGAARRQGASPLSRQRYGDTPVEASRFGRVRRSPRVRCSRKRSILEQFGAHANGA